VLRQVQRKLADVRIPVAGMVLNALEPRRANGGYYYYYPYYGYGRKYEASKSENV
jgi:Mrp family chromosome partitioning ATPase